MTQRGPLARFRASLTEERAKDSSRAASASALSPPIPAPAEVPFRRVRELVRKGGALLNREFAALAALDLLQQRLLDQVGTAARQCALALAVASLFLGAAGPSVTLPLPTPLRQPLWPAGRRHNPPSRHNPSPTLSGKMPPWLTTLTPLTAGTMRP